MRTGRRGHQRLAWSDAPRHGRIMPLRSMLADTALPMLICSSRQSVSATRASLERQLFPMLSQPFGSKEFQDSRTAAWQPGCLIRIAALRQLRTFPPELRKLRLPGCQAARRPGSWCAHRGRVHLRGHVRTLLPLEDARACSQAERRITGRPTRRSLTDPKRCWHSQRSRPRTGRRCRRPWSLYEHALCVWSRAQSVRA